jgi:hypothetical protein
MTHSLRTKLAALAAAGGLAAAAPAQVPADPPAPVNPVPVNPAPVEPGVVRPAPAAPAFAPRPQVVRWAGGYVVLNGPEVVVRQPGVAGRSTNVVTGSGNGFGNTIVVDNGPGGGGVTIVQNARNGVGNRLVVDPDDVFLDLDLLPAWVLAPACLKPAVLAAPAVAPKPAPADPAINPPANPLPVVEAVPVIKGKNTPFWTKKVWSDEHDCNLYWSPEHKAWFRYHKEDDAYRPVPGQP